MRLFAYRLAAHLGYASVRKMLAEISSTELSEWLAYHQLEPFGQDWYQAGTIASTQANCHRTSDSRAFEATDFMPVPKPDEAEASADEMLTAFDVALGGFSR